MKLDYDKVERALNVCGFEITKIDGAGDTTVCNPLSGREFVFSNLRELNAFVLGLQQNGYM